MADLLLSAEFDDQTTRYFDLLARQFQEVQNRASQANTTLASGTRESSASMAMLAGAIGGVTAKLAEMALQAIASIPQFIMTATQLAATSEATGVALGVVAQNAGYTASEVENIRDQLIELQIASDTASEVLLKLAGAQLELRDSTKLANVALDVATVLNTSEEEALRRITHAIITKNTLILGDMQLQFTANQAYEEYAKVLDKDAAALTAVEQKQAFYYMTIKAGAKLEGARNAAMGTAGKTAANLSERFENLQRAIGKAFLPAYTQIISEISGKLGEMLIWVEENEDAIISFGNFLGGLVGILLDLSNAYGEVVASLTQFGSGAFDRLIVGPGRLLTTLITDSEEAEKRVDNLGVAARQLGYILGLCFLTGISSVKELIVQVGNLYAAIRPLTEKPLLLIRKEDIDQAKANLKELAEGEESFSNRLNEDIQRNSDNLLRMFDLMPEVEQSADDGFGGAADAVENFDDAINEAKESIEELNKKMAEDLAQVAKTRARALIDAQIRESRQREAIERSHQERLTQIEEDAADDRAALEESFRDERLDLDKRYNEQRIDAEVDYRRKLEDIATDYYYEIDELVRKNDAVGIVRAMRENQKTLAEAKKDKARQESDRKTNYDRDLKDLKESQAKERKALKESLAEKLQDAEEARQKDIENLERSLEQQAEDRARHQEWEDEDRREAYADELREAGEHFSEIEGLTDTHLNALLLLHGGAIDDLDSLWEGFYQKQKSRPPPIPDGTPAYGTPEANQPGAIAVDPNDPLAEWYGSGGMGVASEPTTIGIGENGTEAFIAMPMEQTVNHRLSGGAQFSFEGLTPQTEAEIKPLFYEMFTEMMRTATGAG